MKRLSIFLIIVISLSIIFPLISAHEPRFVMDQSSYRNGPIIVNNPEISQAFYGELKGMPDFYAIDSDKDFNLYLQILSPYPSGNRDFSVAVYRNKTLYSLIDGDVNFNWSKFYESFAGDNYWQGLDSDIQVPAGRYLIIVYNSKNSGKYSLAVGKIEAFSFSEQMKTLFILLRLKHDFFGKSYFAVFEGVIGKILLALLIIAIIIVLLIIFLVRRIIQRRRLDKRKKNSIRVRV